MTAAARVAGSDQLQVAGLGRRAAAVCVDAVALALLVVPLDFVLGGGPWNRFFDVALGIAYRAGSHWAAGATPGKGAMGIELDFERRGALPDAARMLAREAFNLPFLALAFAPRSAAMAGGIVLVLATAGDLLAALLSPDRRSWHDRLAGTTVVVTDWRPPPGLRTMPMDLAPASIGRRVAAYLIDGALLAPFGIALSFVPGSVGVVLRYALLAVYRAGCHWAAGATAGKAVMSIEVEFERRGALSDGLRMFAREGLTLALLPVVFVPGPVGLALTVILALAEVGDVGAAFLRMDRRAWHDSWAGTIVTTTDWRPVAGRT